MLTVEALAREKCLPVDYLLDLGLANDDTDGTIIIPYYAEDGEEMFARKRGSGTLRFRQPAGVSLAAYGLFKLDLARRAAFLTLVEGESDCWALWLHGQPALGLPGSGATAALMADSLEFIERVYVHVEPDQGGQQFLSGCLVRLEALHYAGRIFVVFTPDGLKDPADLHADNPEQFLCRWKEALLNATLFERAAPPGPPAVSDKEQVPAVPVFVRLSTVVREPVRWLMPGWIPDGTLTLLDGDPGLGKSTLTLDLAARLSRGWDMPPLPGGTARHDPVGVLLLGAEDSLKNTVGPRLDAAGADSDYVHYFDCVRQGEAERDPLLPWDLELLEDWLIQNAVRLIVVDPLVAFLSSEFDAHKDQDIRRCLRALRKFAEKLDIAMLLLRHLNKLQGGASLYRGGGSIGISGAARSSLIVGRDPADDGKKVLAMNKINVGPYPRSLAYRIEPMPTGAARIAWLGETDLQAHEILWHHAASAQNGKQGGGMGRPVEQIKAAKSLLVDLLSDGQPMAVSQIRLASISADIGWRTMEKAKDEMDVTAFKMGSCWYWRLDDDARPQ